MCVVLKVCKQGALGQGVDTVKEGGEKTPPERLRCV